MRAEDPTRIELKVLLMRSIVIEALCSRFAAIASTNAEPVAARALRQAPIGVPYGSNEESPSSRALALRTTSPLARSGGHVFADHRRSRLCGWRRRRIDREPLQRILSSCADHGEESARCHDLGPLDLADLDTLERTALE